MGAGSAVRHTLRRVIVCLVGVSMLVSTLGVTCAEEEKERARNLLDISINSEIIESRIAASVLFVELTEFQSRFCSIDPVPVSNDHTTIKEIAPLLISLDDEQVEALFNGPSPLFPPGDGPNALTIGPEGSTSMPPGQYVIKVEFRRVLFQILIHYSALVFHPSAHGEIRRAGWFLFSAHRADGSVKEGWKTRAE